MKFEGFFIDLDGTIIRKQTVCQIIAQDIGKSARMNELELNHSNSTIVENRSEILSWYKGFSNNQLIESLNKAKFGSGVFQLCNYCNMNKIPFAIVSLTWDFAVNYFAQMFGADSYLGTEIDIKTQEIEHVFPENKRKFVIDFALEQKLDISKCCAIGDSWGDYPMLEACGLGLVIGKRNRTDLPKNCIEIDARKNLLNEMLIHQKSFIND
ncbi:MAG: hypothetical protein GXO79_06705 [Chlorobi bacterium]|nr:hypothetical protein [Chlorobiota bacterium]